MAISYKWNAKQQQKQNNFVTILIIWVEEIRTKLNIVDVLRSKSIWQLTFVHAFTQFLTACVCMWVCVAVSFFFIHGVKTNKCFHFSESLLVCIQVRMCVCGCLLSHLIHIYILNIYICVCVCVFTEQRL